MVSVKSLDHNVSVRKRAIKVAMFLTLLYYGGLVAGEGNVGQLTFFFICLIMNNVQFDH